MSQRVAALRNAAITSIATYAESALGLLVGVIVARSLGPETFGHYTFAVWLCGWLVMASNHALTTSAIKFVAEARGSAGQALASSLGARLRRYQSISCGVVLASFTLFAIALPPSEWEGLLVWMLPLTVIAVWSRAGFWMMGAIAKGHERFEPENIAVLAAGVVQLLAIVAWSLMDRSLLVAFALFALSGLLMNGVVRLSLSRLGIRTETGPVPADLSSRMNRHLLLTGGLVVVGLGGNRTVETLLLKAYGAPEALGYLAIAATLTKGAVDLLSGGMSSVLLPAMSRAYGEGGTRSVGRIVSESVRYYWFLGLAVAGTGLIVSQDAIRLLYGEGYVGAADAAAWMLVVGGLGAWQSSINALQISTDQQGRRILVSLATLAVNATAGLLLVPGYGIQGAIMSIAITRLFSVLVSWRVAVRAAPFEMPWASMGRLVVAAAAGGVAAIAAAELFEGGAAFVGEAIAFAIVYALMSVVLRAWTDDDYELLRRGAVQFGASGGRGERCVAYLRRHFSSGVRR